MIYRQREQKLKEEKIRVIIRLRDEYNLGFEQIAAHVRKSRSWCSKAYHRTKEGDKSE